MTLIFMRFRHSVRTLGRRWPPPRQTDQWKKRLADALNRSELRTSGVRVVALGYFGLLAKVDTRSAKPVRLKSLKKSDRPVGLVTQGCFGLAYVSAPFAAVSCA